MNRLTAPQLAELKQQLDRSQLHQSLQAELLDHLASEVDSLLTKGHSFETALQQVMQEANPQALAQLNHTYQQALGFIPVSALSRRLLSRRYRQRHSASTQLPIWLRVSALTFIVLMVCMMWVSQRFDVSLNVFRLVWVAGLLSLSAVFSTRLLLRSRSRKLRPRWI